MESPCATSVGKDQVLIYYFIRMFNKIKQFKDLRAQAKKMQEELSEQTVHADAMSGKLALVMDGNQQVLSLEIGSEVLQEGNKEKLQSELKDLFNNAVKKVQKQVAQKMMKDKNLNLNDLLKGNS